MKKSGASPHFLYLNILRQYISINTNVKTHTHKETHMFNTFTDAAIDAVQTSKKNFVNTFVSHEGIARALNQFVDTQTSYTKSAISAGTTAATSLGMIFASKEFFDEMTNSFNSFVPAISKKKGK
jgi:hypothetical protein